MQTIEYVMSLKQNAVVVNTITLSSKFWAKPSDQKCLKFPNK